LISRCRIGARRAVRHAGGGRFCPGYPAGGERKVHGDGVLTQMTEMTEMTQMTCVFYFYLRKIRPEERADAERGARSATPGAGVLPGRGTARAGQSGERTRLGCGFPRPRGKHRAYGKVPSVPERVARNRGTRGAFRYTRGRVCSPGRADPTRSDRCGRGKVTAGKWSKGQYIKVKQGKSRRLNGPRIITAKSPEKRKDHLNKYGLNLNSEAGCGVGSLGVIRFETDGWLKLGIADCPHPQRTASQKISPRDRRVQSWRSHCELGQLALH